MGRLAHLARLALGRSAFEDLANDQEVNGANALDDENQQQYDAKGRPLNPRSLELDAELRHAQNEILAIVGVVEKKDKIIRDGEESHRLMRHTRHHILKAEDDIGDGISTVMLLYPILHMWVGGFIARLQIGLYPSHMSLSSILTHEWHALSQVGLVGGVLRLFPGLCALFRAIFLDIPILLATDQIVGRAQNYFIAGNLVRPAIERQIFTALPFLGVGVSLMFEFALWPITIYADAQRLGFAPVRPFASTFWPTSILPAYRLAWKPLVSAGKLGRLLTPAVLMILYHSCYKDGPTKASTPIGPQSPVFCLFTSYRNPPIDDGYKQVEKPTFISDPFGWTVHRNYLIRTSILKWLGWTMTNTRQDYSDSDDPDQGHFESSRLVQKDSALSVDEKTADKYRSTLLAHLPAYYLAKRIDDWISDIVMLPLESLMIRINATIFLEMRSPKTPLALLSRGHIFGPLGGGPIGELVASRGSYAAWVDVGTYGGRLCFAYALRMGIDILAFGLLYHTVRTIGKRRFHWGATSTNK